MTNGINNKEIRVEYCPTKMMVADFYTKPLQGKIFRLFRNTIMNLDDTETERFQDADKLSVLQNESPPKRTDIKSHGVPSKECVGVNGQTKISNRSGATNVRKNPAGDNDVRTRQLVRIKKPMLLHILRALAAGAA